MPKPQPNPKPEDNTDPAREDHDYDDEKPEHTDGYVPPGGEPQDSSSNVAVWIILVLVAIITIIAIFIGRKVYKRRQNAKENGRNKFNMNYVDGDESVEDSDDDEDYNNKKSHKNKSKSGRSKKHDYSDVGIDNERVRKALLLTTESRNNQSRLGNK